MSIKYGRLFSTVATPQSERIPGSSHVANSAGGYTWRVDDWTRLDRFLVLGSEGGTYYIRQRELTVQNAEAIGRCIAQDGPRVVTRTAEVSQSGRAAKNDPAIFVLAMCAKLGDDATRAQARAALPRVCRIGTHLMHFADYMQAFGGWGRGSRNAVARWYNDMPARKLAYQVVKYQARDGWSNRDLLRLSHPKARTIAHDQIYRWVTRGTLDTDAPDELSLIGAYEQIQHASSLTEVVRLIEKHAMPREAVPTHWLKSADVWRSLLPRMPMTAMMRNLATMTRVGLISPLSAESTLIAQRLADTDHLRKARVHPLAVLTALMTYRAGHGARGKHSWSPVASIVDALDSAFYRTFDNVAPSGARTLLALDVSGSMGCGLIGGVPGLTPRVASAAMALVTAATETQHGFVAFTGAGGHVRNASATRGISTLDISPHQRLDDVVARVSSLPFGGTDCSLPMRWALENRIPVDAFAIYTDSETWCGAVHPAQALKTYRRQMGIDAKLVVVGMVSNGFTIADPKDAGMLDVVGFDAATPPVISDFMRAQSPDNRS